MLSYEEEHAAIVDQLRRRGWSREDALQEADNLMAERIERRKGEPNAEGAGSSKDH